MTCARRAFLLAAASAALPALAEPRYGQVAPSADGIGKTYMGREIASLMGWQGAAWLERADRVKEEGADLLVRELRLERGMTVADVGAGTGYYARRIAAAVAPGLVYAVDIQPELLAMVTDLAKRDGLATIRTVQAREQATGLAASSVDLALLVDVYHELSHPYEVMQDLVRAVRPGGRIVLVEYRAEDAKVPIKALHKMSQAQVLREMAPHGLRHERTASGLPWQHLIVFRKPA
jgi:SAM-dependent methyltransferase